MARFAVPCCRVIYYNKEFRLYLQTRLSNPHYRPEVHAQCTIINFMVTRAGLQEQLLATVVRREHPEWEKARRRGLRSMNQMKIDLQSCEDELLYELTNAQVRGACRAARMPSYHNCQAGHGFHALAFEVYLVVLKI